MRTDTGQVFRLEDYRPSDYLIPRTELTFRLSPDRTAVVAELTIARRPGAARNAPLILDGDGLVLKRIEIDGTALAAADYQATPDQLVIPAPPSGRPFRLVLETEIAPSANQALMGLYRTSGVYCTQCEAEGFRRITYFLDRPDILSVYTVRIEAAAKRSAAAALQRQPPGSRRSARRPALCRLARSVPEAVLSLRAGRRRSRLDQRQLRHRVRAQGRTRHLCRARQGTARRLRHGRAQALDALGRGGVRPRIRPRRLQHRRRVRLQHGRDGEQGPQHLQRQIRAGRRRDRDRRRFRQYRGDHRA